MKRFMLAVAIALPMTMLAGSQAKATCLNLQGGFRIKICMAGFLKASCEPFPCGPCGGGHCGQGGGGYGGGYGHGGGHGGYGGGNGAFYSQGYGGVLSPWYTYWPMDAHFQTPAPTGYPYWPAPMTPAPPVGAEATQPAGYQQAAYQQQAGYQQPAYQQPAYQQPAGYYGGSQQAGYYGGYGAPSYWYGY